MTVEEALIEQGIAGFEINEVDEVLKNYVCSVCYADLVAYSVPHTRIVMISCPEHGNVEKCGRVMKSTVSIELERGKLVYKEVVRNLSDLWPGLSDEGFEYNEAVKMRKHYVCKKCGGTLTTQFKSNDSVLVLLICTKCHGNIEKDGYVKKGEWNANLRTHN